MLNVVLFVSRLISFVLVVLVVLVVVRAVARDDVSVRGDGDGGLGDFLRARLAAGRDAREVVDEVHQDGGHGLEQREDCDDESEQT